MSLLQLERPAILPAPSESAIGVRRVCRRGLRSSRVALRSLFDRFESGDVSELGRYVFGKVNSARI